MLYSSNCTTRLVALRPCVLVLQLSEFCINSYAFSLEHQSHAFHGEAPTSSALLLVQDASYISIYVLGFEHPRTVGPDVGLSRDFLAILSPSASNCRRMEWSFLPGCRTPWVRRLLRALSVTVLFSLLALVFPAESCSAAWVVVSCHQADAASW